MRLNERLTLRLCIVATLLGWGWSWVGIRFAIRFYPPGPLALGRYLVASLTLLPVWWARGGKLPRPAEWPGVALTGLLGFTVYNLAINAGEAVIPAGTASMIVACIPVLTTLGAVLWLDERLSPLGWLGVAIAFGGVALIHHGSGGGAAQTRGLLLLLLGALSATSYNLLSKRYIGRYAALDVTTWAIWCGTLGLLPCGLGLGRAVTAAPAAATWTVVGLGVVPAALCYTLWAFLISRRPLARVANILFLVPVAAVLLGWLILGELPRVGALAGGAVVVAGVVLVARRGKPVAREVTVEL